MGAVTYANTVKSMLLQVPEDLFPAYGAVSEPVARAMAEGVVGGLQEAGVERLSASKTK